MNHVVTPHNNVSSVRITSSPIDPFPNMARQNFLIGVTLSKWIMTMKPVIMAVIIATDIDRRRRFTSPGGGRRRFRRLLTGINLNVQDVKRLYIII